MLFAKRLERKRTATSSFTTRARYWQGDNAMKQVRYPLIPIRMVRPTMPVLVAACASAVMLAGCGGGNTSSSASTAATTKPLTCDDSMKAAFKPDANTTVTLVQAFKKGQDMNLTGTPSS